MTSHTDQFEPLLPEPWIETYTGLQFHFLSPSPEEICLADIAHSLSLQPRFCGHSSFHWSVAAHSILVYQFTRSCLHDPDHQSNHDLLLACLLHDASEAYLHDITNPLKHLPALLPYRELESKIQQQIYDAFNVTLSPDEQRVIDISDKRILMLEGSILMKSKTTTWNLYRQIVPPSSSGLLIIQEYHPEKIKKMYTDLVEMYI